MAEAAYSVEGFDRSVASVGGIDCVVYAIGSGPSVVYFHGGGTFHGFEWARDWAQDFRVILPEHPNFGESGDADFADIDDYAAHYRALFLELGLTSFALAGASMGGLLAATYATQNPTQVERLILVSPAGLISGAVKMPDFSTIPLADLPAMFVHDPAFIAPFWPREPSPAWAALRAREGVAAARTRENPGALDARLRRALVKLTLPTLLLWGDDDRILPTALINEWAGVLPHAMQAIIEKGGHLLLDEFVTARERGLAFLRA